jgi:exonuclease SbcC
VRPRRLRFRALGPYPGEVEIDFDALAADGVFLIHGPTGAGKTFLLDALCFALYGDVPGVRRSDSLHSDHAPPDGSPWVELEFCSQHTRWRVRRVPKHERAKKRGTGTTEVAGSATLERFEDGTWRSVAQKIDEVKMEVERLLGLTAEQFQQVILLPQGKFEAVLRSGSTKREELLRTLFDTTTYESAALWVASEAKQRKDHASGLAHELAVLREKAAERWQSVNRQGQHDPSVADAPQAGGSDEPWPADQASLDDLVEQASAMANRAVSVAVSADETLDSARAEHADTERLAQRWDRRKSLRKRRRELAEAQQAVELDRELLRLAGAAEILRPMLDKAQRCREKLNRCAIDVSKRFAAVQDSWAAAPSLPDDVDIPPVGDAALLDALTSAGTALALHRDTLRRFVADAGKADARQADAAAERETETSQRRLNKQRSEAAAGHEHDRKATEATLLEARTAAEQVPTLRAIAEQARARANAAAELDSLHPKLDAAQRALTLAERAALDRRREALDLRQRYIEGIAAVLAGQLEETSPCPVCGSTDHPDPATPADGAVRIDDVEDAETEAEEAATTEEAKREAHQQITSQVNELRGRVGEAAESPEAAIQLADKLAVKVRSATELAGRVDDLQGRVEASNDAASAATEAAQQAALAANAAADRATAADREAARLRARIEQAIGHADPSAAIDGVGAIDAAIKELVAAAQQQEKADIALRTLSGTLTEQLAASPFATPDEARESLRSSGERAELQRRVDSHDTETGDVEHGLRSDDLQDLPRERPDVDTAADAVADAGDTAKKANHHRTRTTDAHEAINGWAAQHRSRLKAHKRALTEAELWSTVADRCNGHTPPKVSLQRWVLSAHLEEICDSANRRLGSMTGGRYRLSVHRGREWHNAKAGLGLRVHDTHTGSQREVSTLSGGETFQASLSLALGVADAVTARSGGVHLDVLFVDEGFGTLDSEALQLAMDELDRLREGGRTVGLISHVSELRERIRTGIEVQPTDSGSDIRVGTVPRA